MLVYGTGGFEGVTESVLGVCSPVLTGHCSTQENSGLPAHSEPSLREVLTGRTAASA